MKKEILKEKIIETGGRVFEYDLQDGARKSEKAIVICVKTDDEKLLVPRKVYEVNLSKTGYVGVVDENGEKTIYPADFFVFLELSPKASRLVTKAAAVI